VAGLSSQVGAFGLLWLLPLGAAVAAGIGAWLSFAQTIAPASRRAGMVGGVVASGFIVVCYVIALVGVQSELENSGAARAGVSATSLTGIGFWFGLICMIAAVVAAVVGMPSNKIR
jgi:hypothetical protein